MKRENSGYFILPMDRHSNDFISDVMTEFSTKQSTESECDSEMFCGSPLYMSRMIAQSYVFVFLDNNQEIVLLTVIPVITVPGFRPINLFFP